MSKNQKFGLCIDWETTGCNWGGDSSIDYQGISFGAIVFKTDDFSAVERLYCEIKFKPDTYKWSLEAERIHGLTRDHLEAAGETQEDAACRLAELILKYWGPDSKVMVLGHNCLYDVRFTNQLLKSIGIEFSAERVTDLESWIEVHHVLLDTSSTGFIAFGLYKSDDLFECVGFDKRGEHNALTDAEQTLMTCAVIRQLVAAGLEG